MCKVDDLDGLRPTRWSNKTLGLLMDFERWSNVDKNPWSNKKIDWMGYPNIKRETPKEQGNWQRGW